MQYIYGTKDITQNEACVVILGNFDGVHKGHQKLFKIAKDKAKQYGLKTVVFSFYPHPTWVIGKEPKPLIMSRKDKKETISELGMDLLIEYPFTEAFAMISPQAFFEEILLKELKAKVLIVGSNYFFGEGKKGNVTYLQECGNKYQVEVYIVDAVMQEGKVISSSRIRELIKKGNIEKANALLGHPYLIIGQVIHGKQLGRTIGFPTINLIADPDRIYPPNGVYATKVYIYNKWYKAITNIGFNPTVDGTSKRIETHIFNISEDLYGQEVKVAFYKYIRSERKFPSFEDLRRQIEKDKEGVEVFFQS
ncbi:hypothetical protein CS063_04305 [Sporanaerobium hydrogeniformans]|uniref:Uncharacterized protein n=1 Tax=Sporanaerobium hydrogeniformans TaxID=3072179 RepID=A0AC61DFU3_9FIRM|nr:bifunctional riboflavin kinase/FAD synthetase [Sporanaerobium hydrogeniformans]PHV71785.1 hypothetical protein CS063_04305 [Sporanaerobium hydrogeniformans]